MIKIILIICILCINLFSGSRVDDISLSFSGVSPKLLNADGWVKNNTLGKWIKNKNVLSNNPINSTFEKSNIEQNFDSIQCKKIIYNNVEYFVLLIEKDTGLYKFPKIHRNWENFKITQAFIFSKNDIESIKKFIQVPSSSILNLKKNFYLETSMNDKFKILGGENAYTEDVLMPKISKIIREFDSLNMKESCCFNTFRIKSLIDENKHVVRFKIPSSETESSSLINLKVYGTNDLNALDLEYFEVSVEDFMKIFNI